MSTLLGIVAGIIVVIWWLSEQYRTVTPSDLEKLNPTEFEILIGKMLQDQGYRVMHIGGSGDEGVDLTAIRGDEEFNTTLMVQVKHRQDSTKSVPLTHVRAAYGAWEHLRMDYDGLFIVTNGQFTKGAQEFVRGKKIRLLSGNDIAEWLAEAELRRKDLANLNFEE